MLWLVVKLLLSYYLEIVMIDGWITPRERIEHILELCLNIQQGVKMLKLPRMESLQVTKKEKGQRKAKM